MNILFLCTGNSARSILAEALTNHWGRGRFRAFSAGSYPTGKVNPYALAVLEQMRIPVESPRSKSWDEFAYPYDPRQGPMDLIITVCDNAAGEVCPVWPGHPLTAHWGVPDPVSVEESDEIKTLAFREAFETLQGRIKRLVELPIRELGTNALKEHLNEIGVLRAVDSV